MIEKRHYRSERCAVKRQRVMRCGSMQTYSKHEMEGMKC